MDKLRVSFTKAFAKRIHESITDLLVFIGCPNNCPRVLIKWLFRYFLSTGGVSILLHGNCRYGAWKIGWNSRNHVYKISPTKPLTFSALYWFPNLQPRVSHAAEFLRQTDSCRFHLFWDKHWTWTCCLFLYLPHQVFMKAFLTYNLFNCRQN